MSFKQEVIDAIEVYRKNTAHILGENDEIVKAIGNCKKLVEEIEDTSEEELEAKLEELKDKLEDAYAHGYTAAEAEWYDRIVRCKDFKHYKFTDNRAFEFPVKRCE